jgi:hypothetical protein
MVATYSAKGDTFSADKPNLWSSTRIASPASVRSWNLDVAPDGKRVAAFPAMEDTGQQRSSVHLTFLLNFFDEVRRRIPVAK